ncbi:MAG: hypothetical protein AAB884_02515 [Patescibacteria group bacterium]
MPPTGTLTLEQQVEVLINEIVSRLRKNENCLILSCGRFSFFLLHNRNWLVSGTRSCYNVLDPEIDELLEEFYLVQQNPDSFRETLTACIEVENYVRINRERLLREFITTLQKAAAELSK